MLGQGPRPAHTNLKKYSYRIKIKQEKRAYLFFWPYSEYSISEVGRLASSSGHDPLQPIPRFELPSASAYWTFTKQNIRYRSGGGGAK